MHLILFGYLSFKLTSIGWLNIIQSLPSSPIFYLLSVAFVFLPIVAEKLVFHIAAKTKSSPPLKVFIRKHVINKAIMNYAGEGYFIQQLSNLKDFSFSSAAIFVKDLTLIRTFAANFWVFILVLFTVILGNPNVLHKLILASPVMVAIIGTTTIVICIASVVFFRKLTRLEFSLAGRSAAVYIIRSFLAACILIAQWNLVSPGTSLGVWFLFLVIFYLAKKSPIAGDLVFISIAMTLPGLSSGSAEIVAMLLTMAVVLQVIYSLGFLITSELFVQNAKQ